MPGSNQPITQDVLSDLACPFCGKKELVGLDGILDVSEAELEEVTARNGGRTLVVCNGCGMQLPLVYGNATNDVAPDA